jgi:hypothetical protein
MFCASRFHNITVPISTAENFEMTKALTYLAYLLRLWRESETAPWRATLENPHTGEQHNFASIERLFHFLSAQTDEVQPTRRIASEERNKEK